MLCSHVSIKVSGWAWNFKFTILTVEIRCRRWNIIKIFHFWWFLFLLWYEFLFSVHISFNCWRTTLPNFLLQSLFSGIIMVQVKRKVESFDSVEGDGEGFALVGQLPAEVQTHGGQVGVLRASDINHLLFLFWIRKKMSADQISNSSFHSISITRYCFFDIVILFL